MNKNFNLINFLVVSLLGLYLGNQWPIAVFAIITGIGAFSNARRPLASPGFVLVLSALAFNQPIWIVVGLAQIVAAIKLKIARPATKRPRPSTTVVNSTPKHAGFSMDRHIYGTAGGHIGSASQFVQTADVGAAGEKILGEYLNKLAAKRTDMYVFHGLCFTPGKPGADVDHAVVIGNDVLLIDAKLWKSASYKFNAARQVMRNGKLFSGSDVHMDDALRKWRGYLPAGVNLWAFICPVGGNPKIERTFYNRDFATLVSTSDLGRIISKLRGGPSESVCAKVFAQLQ